MKTILWAREYLQKTSENILTCLFTKAFTINEQNYSEKVQSESTIQVIVIDIQFLFYILKQMECFN